MDNLKYFALTYIDLQDNLSIQEKNELAKFVVEANGDQVTYLLYEGEMLEESSIEQMKAIHSAAREAGDAGVTTGALTATSTIAVVAAVITLSFKAYKRFLSKAARACSKFAGQNKTSCMNKYKRDALKAQVAELSKGKSRCSNTKDRAKCVQKIDKKIQSVKVKLGTL